MTPRYPVEHWAREADRSLKRSQERRANEPQRYPYWLVLALAVLWIVVFGGILLAIRYWPR